MCGVPVALQEAWKGSEEDCWEEEEEKEVGVGGGFFHHRDFTY